MSTPAQPTFTLVVATYGRAEVLAPLVASLLAQTYRSFEVVLADQNPDDRIAPLIEPLRAAGLLGAHLTLAQPNLSAARNAGIAAARGRFVAFPDDDCWYEPDTLARAADRLASDAGLHGLAARWVEAPVEAGDLVLGAISPDAMRRFRGGNVASITLILERAAVLAVGGFDEKIGVGRWYGAGEETDLVLALVSGGYRIAHARDVVVHHAFDAGRHQRPRIGLERSRARGTGALWAKHGLPAWVIARGLVAPLIAPPGTAMLAGAACSLGRLEGLLRWNFSEGRLRRRSSEQPTPRPETNNQGRA